MCLGITPCVFKPRLPFMQYDHFLDKKQPARMINSEIPHHHLGSQNRFTWNCLKQRRNVVGFRKYESAMKDGINMMNVSLYFRSNATVHLLQYSYMLRSTYRTSVIVPKKNFWKKANMHKWYTVLSLWDLILYKSLADFCCIV